MTIGVIGAGNLGLSFALLCENAGYDVLVSDINEDYVYNLNQGICKTNEPLIQKMLFEVYDFSATTSNLEVIAKSDIIFTFVPTPSNLDGEYDTTKLFEVTNEFFTASQLEIPIYNKKFIVGCTTNPGDVEQIQNKLRMFDIQVAYNPEVISQNGTILGLENPDILLIGTEYPQLADDLIKIYERIQKNSVNAHVMSYKAAEVTKISINCMIAAKISYTNMIGNLLMKSGLNTEIDLVLNAIGGDSRIGKKNMKYGFGFGGSYLPRSNRALIKFAENLDMKLTLPIAIDEFNKEHFSFLKDHYISLNPNKEVPFVMNYITHKKGSDNLEESQQFKLCVDLLDEGYMVNVIENPEIIKNLNTLSESYNGRLKFFPIGTNPQGLKIDLQ
jgi:nucleotide sugar dehydrogenase